MVSVFNYEQPFAPGSQVSAFRDFTGLYHAWKAQSFPRQRGLDFSCALTANSNPLEWWLGLTGDGKFFDPARYFIICVNKPGSPYGSLSPLSTNPLTQQPYYHDFPVFTIRYGENLPAASRTPRHPQGPRGTGWQHRRDAVAGMAIEEPELFAHIVPLPPTPCFHPGALPLMPSQRMAIEADPSWLERRPDGGQKGLAARSIALLSYRSYCGYDIPARDKKFVEMAKMLPMPPITTSATRDSNW